MFRSATILKSPQNEPLKMNFLKNLTLFYRWCLMSAFYNLGGSKNDPHLTPKPKVLEIPNLA